MKIIHDLTQQRSWEHSHGITNAHYNWSWNVLVYVGFVSLDSVLMTGVWHCKIIESTRRRIDTFRRHQYTIININLKIINMTTTTRKWTISSRHVTSTGTQQLILHSLAQRERQEHSQENTNTHYNLNWNILFM